MKKSKDDGIVFRTAEIACRLRKIRLAEMDAWKTELVARSRGGGEFERASYLEKLFE